MKEFLSSLPGKIKPFLSAVRSNVKSFLSFVYGKAKPFLTSMLRNAKPFLSSKTGKLLVLIFAFVLLLGIGLSRCSAHKTPSEETRTAFVSVDNLEVHKKPKIRSRVLGQLPLDLEVEILEETTVKEVTWGRIDNMKLSDGKKIKGGWIDLQCIVFASDLVLEEPEFVPEVEPEPSPVVITMGTITASKLNIRKGPGSDYDSDGYFYKGDRVEILETKTVDDTVWGRTHAGWVGMGYVRMDGTPIEKPDPNLITDGSNSVLGYGIVMLGELNVRLGPDTIYGKSRTITRGNRYAYYQLQDGWARIENGWVSTEHFYLEGTSTADAFPAIVNTDNLNIRTGPRSSGLLVGTYTQDETIQILAKIGDWGYTDRGWVFLDYVSPYYTTGAGIITNGLNIRTEPTADSEIVGTYTTGDRVTIVEVMDNWGRTDLGWINLKYIAYD